LLLQPEIEIPAGMARHNKQTSVKNRRMNPPRPASSNRGTAYPEPVGKSELPANFPSPSPAFAGPERLILRERAHARLKKAAENGNALSERPANMPRPACRRSNPPQWPASGAAFPTVAG
jgi:hypothetical protein